MQRALWTEASRRISRPPNTPGPGLKPVPVPRTTAPFVFVSWRRWRRASSNHHEQQITNIPGLNCFTRFPYFSEFSVSALLSVVGTAGNSTRFSLNSQPTFARVNSRSHPRFSRVRRFPGLSFWLPMLLSSGNWEHTADTETVWPAPRGPSSELQ